MTASARRHVPSAAVTSPALPPSPLRRRRRVPPFSSASSAERCHQGAAAGTPPAVQQRLLRRALSPSRPLHQAVVSASFAERCSGPPRLYPGRHQRRALRCRSLPPRFPQRSPFAVLRAVLHSPSRSPSCSPSRSPSQSSPPPPHLLRTSPGPPPEYGRGISERGSRAIFHIPGKPGPYSIFRGIPGHIPYS